jgi:hypothetical protein
LLTRYNNQHEIKQAQSGKINRKDGFKKSAVLVFMHMRCVFIS